jgi:hypothetical protein
MYERRKGFTALLSVLSIVIAIIAAIGVNVFADSFSSRFFPWIILVATLLAALASVMSIILSQRLSRKREQQWIFLIYAREDISAAKNLAAGLMFMKSFRGRFGTMPYFKH